jgi:lipoate-protein ligase A
VTTPGARSWAVERVRGSAAVLHARAVPEPPRRAAWVLAPDAPALVLGSTQGPDLVDREAAARRGVALAGRRSGGGAVFVDPATTAWVDLIVPAGDALWHDDVGRAAGWVGRAWQAALADLGVGPTVVHEGALACGPLGRLVCFGTVGAGEVTTPEGAKVVGVSQRRTRAAARFQCAAYSAWQPDMLVELLRLDGDGARSLAGAAVGTGVPVDAMAAALLARLPA